MDVLGDRVLELGPKPDADSPYKNFKLTRDADGVAWLLFDREDTSANTLSADLIKELDKILAELEGQRPTGIVIRSAKKSGFIAGADVNEFRGASDPGKVELEIGRAHAVINRLEELRIPTVAVIHGFCLGGGLEVALACQMRIAIEDARFGFPEVMLGLHPGLGGTARFTQLVNPMQAMPLMLTGKTIDARKAKSLGLVDAVTQERHVKNAVKDAVSGRLKRARPGIFNSASASVVWAASNAGRAVGYSGVTVWSPEGKLLGRIRLPEVCGNVTFGGPKRNRLFMAASQSLYAVYTATQGAGPG